MGIDRLDIEEVEYGLKMVSVRLEDIVKYVRDNKVRQLTPAMAADIGQIRLSLNSFYNAIYDNDMESEGLHNIED